MTSLLRVSGIASVRRAPSSGVIPSDWVLDLDDLGSEKNKPVSLTLGSIARCACDEP